MKLNLKKNRILKDKVEKELKKKKKWKEEQPKKNLGNPPKPPI
jgi:hypothetical protein